MKKVQCAKSILATAHNLTVAAKEATETSWKFKTGGVPVRTYAEALIKCGKAYLDMGADMIANEEEMELFRKEVYGVKPETEN
jgi:hypothetical protein